MPGKVALEGPRICSRKGRGHLNPHGTEFRPPLVLALDAPLGDQGALEDTEHLPWLAQGEPKLKMEKVRMEQPVRWH